MTETTSTETASTQTIKPWIGRGPIIPVIVIEDADTAVPLARALVAGGLSALEVTLRTPAAPAAIEAIATHVPEASVGAEHSACRRTPASQRTPAPPGRFPPDTPVIWARPAVTPTCRCCPGWPRRPN